MKKTMIWVALMATLAGCNTISGLGQDISGAANTVAGWMGG